jgi:Mn-dependent DtxR family transcriptional regulator
MNATGKYNQSAEDYLESILLISETSPVVHRIDVAKHLGVSQAAVNKAVKILVEKATKNGPSPHGKGPF